jgi:hypothetical protein
MTIAATLDRPAMEHRMSTARKILLVDDDDDLRESLTD